MRDDLVAKSLLGTGMSPSDWYQLLNNMVFFFVRNEGLHKLLNATSYRDSEHEVVTLDTASLIATHSSNVRLCAINSGATFANPQPRGPDTFLPIDSYPFDELARRRRSRKKAVAECCVLGGVSAIEEHTLTVFRMKGSEPIRQLW